MSATPGPSDAVIAARDCLSEAPVFDGHNDLPWALRKLAAEGPREPDPSCSLAGRTHTDLDRLAAGGVGAQFWSVFVPAGGDEAAAVVLTLEQIDLVRRMIRANPDRLVLATTADEALAARGSRRIASFLGAEGGHCIADSLGVLRALHALGVRYLTLTHGASTAWAESATGQPVPGGLTDFGRAVVAELNRIGVLVDLSHVSPATMHAALDTTRRPVLFSHSSARALVDHPRNVPDDVLQRLPGNGGVCQVTFVPPFVSAGCKAWADEVSAAMTTQGLDPWDWDGRAAFVAGFQPGRPRPRATLADVADHIEHVREVAGVAHVGLGGDFDGTDELPIGLEDVTGYPRLIAELLDRRWSRADLAKLTWENVLRVVRDACDGGTR